MEPAIITAVISGMFSLAVALGSIWFEHWLKKPRIANEGILAETSVSSENELQSARGANIIRPITILVVSLLLGIFSEILHGTMLQVGQRIYEWGFLAFVAAGVLCLILIFVHRKSPAGFWFYQFEIIILWAAFLSGFSIVHGGIWMDAVSAILMVWFVSAVIGGIVVFAARQ